MAKAPALSNAILDHIVGNATWTSPAPVHISLHTGNPGTTGANEASSASTSNYARVEAAASDWGSAAAGAIANSAAITFPEGGNDQEITHFGVWDSASGGAFQRGGALTAPFTYAANVTPEFAIGACVLSES